MPPPEKDEPPPPVEDQQKHPKATDASRAAVAIAKYIDNPERRAKLIRNLTTFLTTINAIPE